MKIVTIVGARPQFVKAAVVSRALEMYNQQKDFPIREILLHTGQHYDPMMSEVFFREMNIPRPAYHLGIGGGPHGAMTGRMLESIETVLEQEKPDIVLVYGDTNSTLAGALAAVKLHIPVAHVESGLRSWNMHMPEEVNRILTDRIANMLFCPNQSSVKNLQAEGIADDSRTNRNVFLTGDVMYDSVLYYRKHATPSAPIAKFCKDHRQGFVLATIHRAENTDNPECLKNLFFALELLAQEMPVLCPLHPRTSVKMESYGIHSRRITLCEPVGYFDMLTLLEHCICVATDSGGLQKEAYFFRKPCLILRQETEWVELTENGWNRLAGAVPAAILQGFQAFQGTLPPWDPTLYGLGNAGDIIVNCLTQFVERNLRK